SLLQISIYRNDLMLGRYHVDLFIYQALVDDGVPAAIMGTAPGAGFIEKIIKPVYETLRLLCLNRARQRDSMKALLQDWAVVQSDAQVVDSLFCLEHKLPDTTPAHMSNWANREVLRLMSTHMKLGLELELQAGHELLSAYWYWGYITANGIEVESEIYSSRERLRHAKVGM
ncbi:unnamed protein product, partial [Chrysoparadoxa australica]